MQYADSVDSKGVFFDGTNEVCTNDIASQITEIQSWRFFDISCKQASIKNYIGNFEPFYEDVIITNIHKRCKFYNNNVVVLETKFGEICGTLDKKKGEIHIPTGSIINKLGGETIFGDSEWKVYAFSPEKNDDRNLANQDDGTIKNYYINEDITEIVFKLCENGDIQLLELPDNGLIGAYQDGVGIVSFLYSEINYTPSRELIDKGYHFLHVEEDIEFKPYEMRYATPFYSYYGSLIHENGRRRKILIGEKFDQLFIAGLYSRVQGAIVSAKHKWRDGEELYEVYDNKQLVDMFFAGGWTSSHDPVEQSIPAWIGAECMYPLNFNSWDNNDIYRSSPAYFMVKPDGIHIKPGDGLGLCISGYCNMIDQVLTDVTFKEIPKDQKPMPPTINVKDQIIVIQLPGTDEANIILDHLDELYLKVNVDGTDYIFDTESLGKTLELPFFYESAEYLLSLQGINGSEISKYSNFYNGERGFKRGADGYGRVVIPLSEENSKIEASAVYYADGERKLATATYICGVGNIEDDTVNGKMIMYDLAGRKVNSATAQPGIYICNGKKILLN